MGVIGAIIVALIIVGTITLNRAIKKAEAKELLVGDI